MISANFVLLVTFLLLTRYCSSDDSNESDKKGDEEASVKYSQTNHPRKKVESQSERGGSNDEFCRQKPETGKCSSHFKAWYFDYETKKCKPYFYSGCGASKNFFKSEADCLVKCLGETDTSALKAATKFSVKTTPSLDDVTDAPEANVTGESTTNAVTTVSMTVSQMTAPEANVMGKKITNAATTASMSVSPVTENITQEGNNDTINYTTTVSSEIETTTVGATVKCKKGASQPMNEQRSLKKHWKWNVILKKIIKCSEKCDSQTQPVDTCMDTCFNDSIN